MYHFSLEFKKILLKMSNLIIRSLSFNPAINRAIVADIAHGYIPMKGWVGKYSYKDFLFNKVMLLYSNHHTIILGGDGRINFRAALKDKVSIIPNGNINSTYVDKGTLLFSIFNCDDDSQVLGKRVLKNLHLSENLVEEDKTTYSPSLFYDNGLSLVSSRIHVNTDKNKFKKYINSDFTNLSEINPKISLQVLTEELISEFKKVHGKSEVILYHPEESRRKQAESYFE